MHDCVLVGGFKGLDFSLHFFLGHHNANKQHSTKAVKRIINEQALED